MALPAHDDHDDHRRERRSRVLKGGTIITGVNNSEIACTIRNMHPHGAELRVSAEARVPSEFLLYVPVDGIAYRGRFAGSTSIALFERAADAFPNRPELSLPLAHPALADAVDTAAHSLGYIVT